MKLIKLLVAVVSKTLPLCVPVCYPCCNIIVLLLLASLLVHLTHCSGWCYCRLYPVSDSDSGAVCVSVFVADVVILFFNLIICNESVTISIY